MAAFGLHGALGSSGLALGGADAEGNFVAAEVLRILRHAAGAVIAILNGIGCCGSGHGLHARVVRLFRRGGHLSHGLQG